MSELLRDRADLRDAQDCPRATAPALVDTTALNYTAAKPIASAVLVAAVLGYLLSWNEVVSRGKGGDVPVIAWAAYARAENRVKAVRAGFLMHVAKPVEWVAMVAGAAGRTGRPF